MRGHIGIAVLALALAVPIASAQVQDYYAITVRDQVPVYSAPSRTAAMHDVLDRGVVLIILDDPRNCRGFLPVEPDPDYIVGATWTRGYVQCGDIRVETSTTGLVAPRRPLPTSRAYFLLSGSEVQAETRTFQPETSLEIADVFGSGEPDALIAGAIGWQSGAPARSWAPILGSTLELSLGLAPRTSLVQVGLVVGPTLGVKLGRGLGLHGALRGGGVLNVSLKGPDGPAEGFTLTSYGGVGQATAGLSLGSVNELRVEGGYQYALMSPWKYSLNSESGFVDSGLTGDPVSFTGAVARVVFTRPLGFVSSSAAGR